MITQKELKRVLDYNKNTGIFTWKVLKTNCVKVGDIAGNLYSEGYIRICIDNKRHRAHRLAWLYEYGELPKQQIDHINRIKTDNRICNLRDVSNQENCKNVGIRKNNTSGNIGVRLNKFANKWVSYIGNDGKIEHLGYFSELSDAIKARKEAEEKYSYYQFNQ